MERAAMFLTAKQRSKGSLNPDYASMCGGKLRHYNFLTAIQHARHLEKVDKKIGRSGTPVVYHCDFCGAEHIGHLAAPKFRFPSSEEMMRTERDKRVSKALKLGNAVARQGEYSVRFITKSS